MAKRKKHGYSIAKFLHEDKPLKKRKPNDKRMVSLGVEDEE